MLSQSSQGDRVRQAAEGALAILELERRFTVERIVFSEQGQWCVRLRALKAPDLDLSVCIGWVSQGMAANTSLFADKMARYLAFGLVSRGGDLCGTRGPTS